MTSWPVQCVATESVGRMAVATRDIDAGETVFAEVAYTLLVQPPKGRGSGKNLSCTFCGCFARMVVRTCSKCGGVYCSADCALDCDAGHVARGECMARQLASLVLPHVAPEDRETLAMILLIVARAVCEGRADQLRRSRQPPSAAEQAPGVGTVALRPTSLDPSLFLGRERRVAESTYEHVQCLAHGIDTMDPIIHADFVKLHDIYTKRLRRCRAGGSCEASDANGAASTCDFAPLLVVEVSRDTFVALCGAFLCNGFGAWDRHNRKMSTAVYPQSSYFNHSCAPNLARVALPHSRQVEFFAVRRIVAGEPLFISYVDVKLPARERRAKLRATYGFDCHCVRCAACDGTLSSALDTVSSGLVPLMCGECASKILRPSSGGLFVCPACGQAHTREGEPHMHTLHTYHIPT